MAQVAVNTANTNAVLLMTLSWRTCYCAAPVLYRLMEDKWPQAAVNYGAAHGALAMTTPGDTTTDSLQEVQRVMKGGGARISR